MWNILWCRHTFALKIKIMRKYVSNCMPAERQDLGHSTKYPSKRNRHTDVVLLHRELYLNMNRHIRQGRGLTNIGLWSRVPKISTSVKQKPECPEKP